MSSNKYRITCNECGDLNMFETISSVVVSSAVRDFEVLLLDVPFFYCGSCGNIAYRKALGMSDILENAFENGYNTVLFENKDLENVFGKGGI